MNDLSRAELDAMQEVAIVLDTLPPDTQVRVVFWMMAKYAAEGSPLRGATRTIANQAERDAEDDAVFRRGFTSRSAEAAWRRDHP